MSKAIENKAAKSGWEEFAATNPPPSRDTINHVLAERGLPPISQRMYKHYRGLVRHGYDRYGSPRESVGPRTRAHVPFVVRDPPNHPRLARQASPGDFAVDATQQFILAVLRPHAAFRMP